MSGKLITALCLNRIFMSMIYPFSLMGALLRFMLWPMRVIHSPVLQWLEVSVMWDTIVSNLSWCWINVIVIWLMISFIELILFIDQMIWFIALFNRFPFWSKWWYLSHDDSIEVSKCLDYWVNYSASLDAERYMGYATQSDNLAGYEVINYVSNSK